MDGVGISYYIKYFGKAFVLINDDVIVIKLGIFDKEIGTKYNLSDIKLINFIFMMQIMKVQNYLVSARTEVKPSSTKLKLAISGM